MGRSDEFRRRASKYKCPWCGDASNYVDPSFWRKAKIEGRGARIGFLMALAPLNVVEFVKHLDKPKGVDAVCSGCNEAVTICPRCDAPSRPAGVVEECKECKNTYL